jgi:hypothetical protein
MRAGAVIFTLVTACATAENKTIAGLYEQHQNETSSRRLWALSGLTRALMVGGKVLDKASPFVDLAFSALSYDDPRTQFVCGDGCQWYGKNCSSNTSCASIDRAPWYGQHCADEHGHCKCYGKVLYGYFFERFMHSLLETVVGTTGFRVAQNVEEGIDCTNAAIGHDPTPGTVKSCRCMMEWDRIPDAGVAVSLKSVHKDRFCANEKDKVVCTRGSVGSWERFKLVPNMDRSGFFLRSTRNNRNCLTHYSASKRKLMCPDRYPGHGGVTWFDSLELMHYVPEDQYSLRRLGAPSNRGYCSDHCNLIAWWCAGGDEIRCDRDSVDRWEKFKISLIDDSRRLESNQPPINV